MTEDLSSLKPTLLRSSTPAPSEKVLLYLEGMSRHVPVAPLSERDFVDTGSECAVPANAQMVPLPPSLYAPSPRSGGSLNARGLEDLALSDVGHGAANGARAQYARSDVQERQQSPNGSPVDDFNFHLTEPLNTRAFKHESFESDPSFGNLDPPRESTFGPMHFLPGQNDTSPWNATSTPAKAAAVPLPSSPVPPIAAFSHFSFQPFALPNTPGAAQVPLPGSVASPSVNIDLEPPSSPSRSRFGASHAASRASQKVKSVASADQDPEPADIQSNGRSPGSRPPTVTNGDRPLSPRSHASLAKSRATQKSRAPTEKGTTYPPLPESIIGSDRMSNLKSPPPERALSKGPSRALSPLSETSSKADTVCLKDGASALRSLTSHNPPQSTRVRSELGDNVDQPSGGSFRYAKSNANEPTSLHSQHLHPNPTSSQAGGRSRAMSPSKSHRQETSVHSRHTGTRSRRDEDDPQATPTPSRPQSPQLDQNEERLVQDLLSRTPHTSYAPSALETEVQNSHFHDMDLCILLHAADDEMAHEVVKKAVRKAVRARIKKLGMKYDAEAIKQYRKSYHDHDPSVHLQPLSPQNVSNWSQDPPDWAKDIMKGVVLMQQRLDSLGPKIESLKSSQSGSAHDNNGKYKHQYEYSPSELEHYGETPMTQTVNIRTQPTGTMADESIFQHGETEITVGHTIPGSMHHHDGSTHGIQEGEEYDDDDDEQTHQRGYTNRTPPTQDGETRTHGRISEFLTDNRMDSPGQQYLEEELYKLRVKPTSQSGVSHKTWEVARDMGEDDEDEDDPEERRAVSESEMIPEIPGGSALGHYDDPRKPSPPLPPLPLDSRRDLVITPASQVWQQPDDYNHEPPSPPPWQRIHQRLLNWAIVWPMSELASALNSTTRGHQVDEVALSIWSTQSYKRYVRSKMTDSPPGRVDRLFVPPNMADAISNAVFHGRHGDACGMLRDLWSPFGLDGMPRLLIVLAKHRTDENHWVVHRFSLPDGTLTTYDTFPERCLPDGRPLGWWFAIRIAWPNAIYPSPDHLVQKMVRLHRPMQLGIDNSVAAAGIWRNLLMGSRAERSLDLERLRDLINTEVKNLQQRKEMGKLSIGAPKPNWEDMN